MQKVILKEDETSGRNDHDFSRSLERHTLDIPNWRVEVFTSSSNRRGKSLGSYTRYAEPEDYGITKDTVITRDESLPLHHKGGLRVYYSDEKCYLVETKIGGYMFDEVRPDLPFVEIPEVDSWISTSIKRNLEGIWIGSDEVVKDTWIIDKLIESNATAIIDLNKLKIVTGCSSIEEYITQREEKRAEEARLRREEAKKWAAEREAAEVERKLGILNEIKQGTHDKFLYAIEKGSMRIFSGDFIEKSKVTPEEREDSNMYCKVLRSGKVNGIPYKDVCSTIFWSKRFKAGETI